jgi:hypothetical protein
MLGAIVERAQRMKELVYLKKLTEIKFFINTIVIDR